MKKAKVTELARWRKEFAGTSPEMAKSCMALTTATADALSNLVAQIADILGVGSFSIEALTMLKSERDELKKELETIDLIATGHEGRDVKVWSDAGRHILGLKKAYTKLSEATLKHFVKENCGQ